MLNRRCVVAKVTLSNIGQLLRDRRGKGGIRDVAREIGISPATLSRVENGKLPDLDTFSKVCKWLRIDPGEVLGCKNEVPGSSSPQDRVISAHLRADKNQSPEAAQALAEMILAAQRMISESYRK
jgi:transcriptional regulator with XRE-family HTH domain